MTRKNLVIFTHGAPFANGENAFLFPELPILAEAFERVILVPDVICHAFSRCEVQLPAKVEVYSVQGMKRCGRNTALARAFLSFKWIRDIQRIKRPSHLIASLLDIDAADTFKSVFQKLLRDLSLGLHDTLFYTFWMTHEAAGLAEMSLVEYADLCFVSRAHGYDLYDYRVNFRSRYYRELTINQSRGIYCCSEDGARHLKTRYSACADKIRVGYLGVKCTGVNAASWHNLNGNELRLVTVANLVPVKQHLRFIVTLKAYAARHPEMLITYDIIGEGPLKDEILRQGKSVPPNLAIDVLGLIPNAELMERYAKVPYDLFVLPSRSEGLSVAVMEAMARGIPALVTAVGGMPELVQKDVSGFLMLQDFRTEDVERVIDFYLNVDKGRMRDAARRTIAERFEVKGCRQNFVNEIVRLGAGR